MKGGKKKIRCRMYAELVGFEAKRAGGQGVSTSPTGGVRRFVYRTRKKNIAFAKTAYSHDTRAFQVAASSSKGSSSLCDKGASFHRSKFLLSVTVQSLKEPTRFVGLIQGGLRFKKRNSGVEILC